MSTTPGSSRAQERISGLPLSMATLDLDRRASWSPNWIEYRSSVANVDRRQGRSEPVATCRECGCETDVTPAPHSPKCPTLTAAEPNGRELLERMDAGEPVRAVEAPVAEPEPEPDEEELEMEMVETATANGISEHRFGLRKFGRGYIWTSEAAIAAVKEFAQEHDRAPALEDARKAASGDLPSKKSAVHLFGGWPELLNAAGLEGSGREPQAAKRETRLPDGAEPRRRGEPPFRPDNLKKRTTRKPPAREAATAQPQHAHLEQEAERIEQEIVRLQERAELCRRIAADLRKLEELTA